MKLQKVRVFMGEEHRRLMEPHVKTEKGICVACGRNSKELSLCVASGAKERERMREGVGEGKEREGREGSSTIMGSEGRGMWFTFKASSLLPIQASLLAQTGKNLPAMEETCVWGGQTLPPGPVQKKSCERAPEAKGRDPKITGAFLE